jgi:predicted Holliday junction resolvase-like endonuclease
MMFAVKPYERWQVVHDRMDRYPHAPGRTRDRPNHVCLPGKEDRDPCPRDLRSLAGVDLAGWKAGELERVSEEKARILFAGWKAEEEENIRSDAVRRSQSVTKGKITEHLIPYFPDFPYNPKDARFLGSPVDLVVFDGLSEDTVREIVFVEIKTAKHPTLSRRERAIRDCVSERRVLFKLIQVVPETDD